LNSFDDVLILIPVYNEDKKIQIVVDALLKYFRNILVINDGSTDDTFRKLLKYDLFLINHPLNLGQGAALDTGFEFFINNTNFEYLVTFDGDNQHNINDLIEMIKKIKVEDIHGVVGSRFIKKTSLKNVPNLRIVILILAKLYEKIFYGSKFTDAHNGLRILKRDVVQSCLMPLDNYDMSHATEISYKLSHSHFKIKEYPVTFLYHDMYPQSVLNAINLIFKNIFSNKR
tara:strand:+ start:3697 stop:4383 length:687 start_codon:yes stop_codon:yes gene_type:complete